MIDQVFDEIRNAEGKFDDANWQHEAALGIPGTIDSIEAEIGAPVRMVTTSPVHALWRY